MPAIAKLCQRVALLDLGKLRAIGSPQEIVAEYMQRSADKQRAVVRVTPEDLVEPIKGLIVTTFDGKGEITGSIILREGLQIRVEFEISAVLEHCIVAVGLRTRISATLQRSGTCGISQTIRLTLWESRLKKSATPGGRAEE